MKKRRFASGGFSDIDEGRDTPDQALARKASMSPMAASDKAAGLASTKGQDVGLKRLFMGNIDAPGSEASNSFGAGKGSSDRMAQAADQNLPVRPTQRPSIPAPPRPAPAPVVSTPTSDLGEIKDEAGTVSRFRRNTETGEAYDPGSATDKKPVAVKKPTVQPSKSKAISGVSDEMKRGSNNNYIGYYKDYEGFAPSQKKIDAGAKNASPMYLPDSEKERKRKEFRKAIDSESTSSKFKKGGSIKAYASGGSVSSRADGCAQRGKTRGMMR